MIDGGGKEEKRKIKEHTIQHSPYLGCDVNNKVKKLSDIERLSGRLEEVNPYDLLS